MKKLLLSVALVAGVNFSAQAQQVYIDKNAELIPISAYNAPEGSAGDAAALAAIKIFMGHLVNAYCAS